MKILRLEKEISVARSQMSSFRKSKYAQPDKSADGDRSSTESSTGKLGGAPSKTSSVFPGSISTVSAAEGSLVSVSGMPPIIHNAFYPKGLFVDKAVMRYPVLSPLDRATKMPPPLPSPITPFGFAPPAPLGGVPPPPPPMAALQTPPPPPPGAPAPQAQFQQLDELSIPAPVFRGLASESICPCPFSVLHQY